MTNNAIKPVGRTSSATRSGIMFDYFSPTSDMIRKEDIAHAASNLCRFNGHIKQFFSVAQHAVEVANLITYLHPDLPKEAAFAGLMHDSHESYIGDFPTPFKRQLGEVLLLVEQKTIDAIEKRFGIAKLMQQYSAVIKEADALMLYSDALRWGADGNKSLFVREGEYVFERVRKWVPDDAVIYFADAKALKPKKAKKAFLRAFDKYAPDWITHAND